jgi:hypothetical protein
MLFLSFLQIKPLAIILSRVKILAEKWYFTSVLTLTN